MIKYFVFFMY